MSRSAMIPTGDWMQLVWMTYAFPAIASAWSALVLAVKGWLAPRTRSVMLDDDTEQHAWVVDFVNRRFVDVDAVRVMPSGGRLYVPDVGAKVLVLASFVPHSSDGDIRCDAARCLSTSLGDRVLSSIAWLCFSRSVVISVRMTVDDGNKTSRFSVTSSSARLGGVELVRALVAFVDLAGSEFRASSAGTVSRIARLSTGASISLKARVRPLSTIVLDADVRRTLVDAVEAFMRPDTIALYERIGRVRKLCILIHGPPGTGKSSVLPYLCHTLCAGAKRLVSSSVCDDRAIAHAMTQVHFNNTMIVFEDIDRSFKAADEGDARGDAKKDAKGDAKDTLSLGTLFELLDGTNCSAEKSIIVLTANDTSVLPPALIRPGRVDLVVEFGYATEAMLREYVRVFHDGAVSEDEAAASAAALVDQLGPTATIAQAQAILFRGRAP